MASTKASIPVSIVVTESSPVPGTAGTGVTLPKIETPSSAPSAAQQNSGNGTNGAVGDAALLQAVKAGSLAEVRRLLTSNSITSLQKLKMLDWADEHGRTALHYAAMEGKVRIVLLLLEQETCVVDRQDNQGDTPAHLAIKADRDGMVVWLGKKGADLKKRKDNQGKSVLDYATPKLLDILRQYEDSLLAAPLSNMRSKSMRAEHSELLELCHHGDLVRVKQILENPGTSLRKMIDDRGLEGKNPLHIACETGNTKLAEYLLSLGADPNREEEYMNVPLTIAVTCYKGDPEMVRLLIQYRAKVNTKSMFGLVPLIIAAENGHLDLVRLLIDMGKADVNSDDNAGNTALHLAAQEGHEDIVRFLIERGADVNRKNESGQTPLEVAMPNARKLICELKGIPYVEEEVVVGVIEKTKSSGSLEIALAKEMYFNWSDVQLGEKIGAGSFGAVYEAQWKGKKVAIKKLNVTNPSSLRMAKNEIHAMKGTSHPNVVGFYAASITKEDYSIMTEIVNGGSLSSLVHKQKKTLKAPEVIHFGLCIAKGMHYLHTSRRIVHRDLRTDNILLADDNGTTIAKVSDFGLACDLSVLNKRGQMKVGSLRWMAPEVYIGGVGENPALTPKIDVYSFSMLMWEMIANDVPFFAEAPLQVAQLAAEQNRRPPIPQEFVEANPDLVALIESCWNANVAERPAFEQVVSSLEAIQAATASS